MAGFHSSAHVRGVAGHRLVATLAEQQLTPRTKSEIDRLLAAELGATLASISTRADESRSPRTAPWHYVNLPRDADCQYDAARDCPNGQCVVGAIERQLKVLVAAASDTEKLQALKYLVHFVADIHQPLHVGECLRFVKLALCYPSLLTRSEQLLWEHFRATPNYLVATAQKGRKTPDAQDLRRELSNLQVDTLEAELNGQGA